MSKNELTASGAAQGEQSTDSVYDFLYYDARRVGSFLAQFDQFGHLQNVTKGESASKGGKRGKHWKIGGSVPMPGSPDGAELSISGGIDPAQGGSESLALGYDPFWANARTFLDLVDESGLLQRDATKARIGQFVLISGNLSFYDLHMLKGAWESEVIERLIRAGAEDHAAVLQPTQSRQQRRAEGRSGRGASPAMPSQMDILFALLKIVPHSLQVRIDSQEHAVWCGLREDFPVGSPIDLTLKHGASVAGIWSLVGVLDAQPGKSSLPTGDLTALIEAGETTMGSFMAGAVQPTAREMVGRPARCFGVTPLLIFREVGG